MEKKCIICGAAFNAPPSSKKVTCSKACSRIRASIVKRDKYKWSDSARQKRIEKAKTGCFDVSLSMGTKSALEIPEGQRGPQNRESKVWELIDPSGNHIVVCNLTDWARKNYHRFDPDATDVDKAASIIYHGFSAIASSMRGVKSRKRPAYTYKGWSLACLPKHP